MKKGKRGWLVLAGIVAFAFLMVFSFRINAEAAKATSLVTSEGKLAKGFSVTLSKTRYSYQGGQTVKPTFVVKYGKKTLTAGKDYKYAVSNAKNVGTATLKIKGIGSFEGLYRTKFSIVRRPADEISARTRYQVYYYNGNARKPGVVIGYKVNGKTVFLKKGRDFTLAYKNNVGPGTGKVVVTFQGKYSGKKTLSFTIKSFLVTPTPTPVPTILPMQEVAKDGEHLTAAWYASLVEKGNFVFSPYSLKDCASILYPAAGGNSKTEMEEVLGLSETAVKALRESDANAIFQNGIGMKSANKAYLNKLDPAMQNAHPEVLDTDQLDIREFDANTYQDINSYVAEATEDKIKNLLGADDVGPDTSAVLLNCIYFMNTWFHTDGKLTWNGTKRVDSFMDDVSLKNIKEDGAIDILRLPYSNIPKGGKTAVKGMDTYAMYIICDSSDSANVGVDAFMSGLSEKDLAKLTDFSGYAGLQGYDEAWFNVPEFETRTRTSLNELLSGLGAKEIFMKNVADFRKFADVYIDRILQEAYIKTTFEGTEAAAATAIIAKANSAAPGEPKKTKRVIADTTFAFVLKDDTTGQILFVGRVANP